MVENAKDRTERLDDAAFRTGLCIYILSSLLRSALLRYALSGNQILITRRSEESWIFHDTAIAGPATAPKLCVYSVLDHYGASLWTRVMGRFSRLFLLPLGR